MSTAVSSAPSEPVMCGTQTLSRAYSGSGMGLMRTSWPRCAKAASAAP